MEEKEKVSRREKNKQKVIECALESFIEKGIENSKIADIAEKAELTERSAFRYFDSKENLVLEAVFLFWNESVTSIDNLNINRDDLTGIELMDLIFKEYADLFKMNKKKFIFIQEAEVYLTRCGKSNWIKNKPPLSFDESHSPLANAIRKGVEDGTVRSDINLNYFYLNSFDCLLGLLQKLAINTESKIITDSEAKDRLKLFCSELTNIFRA